MATLPEIDAIFIFCKWKGPILISYLDSTLNFEFRTSFYHYLSVIVFHLFNFFRKKAGLQNFIKKCITPEPLEINNSISKGLADLLCHW
jgi:hypothetical protein